ncbi:MAG: ribosome silencing factor [Gammaproteobacteria bacterium]|nr:MAG: ribosome silencing factor [Gammaproteobacteria bacterium]
MIEAVLERVVAALEDLKARDIRVLDVRGQTSIADYMVIASGSSDRHVKSLSERVIEANKRAGEPPLGVEGLETGDWVLVDLGDVIVHVMLPQTRAFYNLEKLWTVEGEAAEGGTAAGLE